MKVKKRKKSSRFRGSHTHGRGFKKKARGSGHRGGFGMAGTGKRGDQRKTLVINLYGNDYFGKDKARRAGKKIHIEIMTLDNISRDIDSLVKKGLAKENKGSYEINLNRFKIIGNKTELKLKISALAASKGAQEAVKKAGGEIIVNEKNTRAK